MSQLVIQTRRRILVIDDNRTIHDDFRKILLDESLGLGSLSDLEAALFNDDHEVARTPDCTVDSAYQGEEALRMVERAVAENRPYALAFVDMRMPPGWNGIETILHLWQADPRLQVVICTAYSDYSWEEIIQKLRRTDQFIILKKPFDVIEVRQLAFSLTDKWQLAEQLHGRLSNLEHIVQERTRELQDALAISRTTLESTADGILVANFDGSIACYNQKFLDIWQLPADSMIDRMTILRLASEKVRDPEAFVRRAQEIYADSESVSNDIIEFLDGRTIERYSQPYRLNDRILGRVWSFRNVTKRQQAEAALRRSEERCRTIIDNEPEGIITLNREACMMQVNPAGLVLLEIENQPFHGESLLDFIIPAHHFNFMVAVTNAFTGEKSKIECEVSGRRGHNRWIEAHLVPLLVHNCEILSILLVARDITDQRQMEIQLRQAQKIEAVGKLAGGIAHDFNNLLTIINGHCQLLLMDLSDPEKTREAIAEIGKAGERAASLTRQLLAFSRKQVLQPRVMCLNALLADIEKMLCRLIGEDVELVVQRDPDLWFVKIDPGQMTQVIMNLAVNSRDAMPLGGRLAIETRNITLDAASTRPLNELPAGDYVLLTVTDTGCGMDSQTLTRIFDPFFTSKGPDKGTGLGLSTAYGIVKQSRGHIEVDSTLGAGTTFRLFFPRDSSEKIAEECELVPVRGTNGSKETILLVEDDKGVRELARMILEQNGYRVVEAVNGEEAIKFAAQLPALPLVVTDMVMPGINGRELARQIRKLRPNCRILYVSGYTGEIMDQYGMQQTKTPFLQKPFAPDAFLRTIRALLDSPLPAEDYTPLADEAL